MIHSLRIQIIRYRFIYVKIAKNAGSTIGPAFLRPTICKLKPGEQGKKTVWDLPFSESCADYEFVPTDSDLFMCHRIPRDKWLSYYVFTSVRDPVIRALSSYTYCGKQKQGVSVGDFCRNPNLGVGCHNPNAAVNGPNVHWVAQSGSLCDVERGKCIMEYAVRVESLAEDMDVVMKSINANRNQSYPALPLYSQRNITFNRQGLEKKNPKKRDSILQELMSEPCATNLMGWYGPDFELFGYPPPAVKTGNR